MREVFSAEKYPSEKAAMEARNKRARDLRAQGNIVECSTANFSGFGYGKAFFLEYTPKQEVRP